MPEILFETHLHTKQVSSCSKVDAADAAGLFKLAGYSGICVTDHYYDGYFAKLDGLPWEEKIDQYLSGYRQAKEAGKEIGMHVLFGLELRFEDSPNDYLVYGPTREELIAHPALYEMTLESFTPFSRSMGWLIYQAHPYRPHCQVAPAELLDGIEVYNGHPGHLSSNDLALAYGEAHGLRQLSGSDFHQYHHLARGGVVLPELPADEKEWANVLRENRITSLITT